MSKIPEIAPDVVLPAIRTLSCSTFVSEYFFKSISRDVIF